MFPGLQNSRHQYGSGIVTSLRNKANRALKCPPQSHLYPGEHHLQLGRCSAAYAGPGTRFFKRQARGDEPIGPVDECAEEHDRAYARAGYGLHTGESTEEQAGELVRTSDRAFVTCVNSKRKQAPVNARLAMRGFKAKMAAEDRLGVPRSKLVRLSKSDLADIEEIGEAKARSILRMSDKSVAKIQKQAGLGMVPAARMRAVLKRVGHYFSRRGNDAPSHAQVTALLKRVVKQRRASGKRVILPAGDPMAKLTKQIDGISGGSWAGTASTALGLAGLVSGPAAPMLEGASGLLAIGDLIFG